MRSGRSAVVAGCIVAALLAGCSSVKSIHSSAAPPATTAPAAPATTAVVSNLTITGVRPGVEQTPFYPPAPVTKVGCGLAPGVTFVEFIVPPGGAAGTALSIPTSVVVVPGDAVLKDYTGKALYRLSMASIKTGRQGSLVLSLNSVTYLDHDGRSVPQGAVNITGDYTCIPGNIPYPGL